MKRIPFKMKNGDTKCYECGTWCQGTKGPNGKIYCSDCLWKVWGMKP